MLYCQNHINCKGFIERDKAVWFNSGPHCNEECNKHQEIEMTCKCGKLREYVKTKDIYVCPICSPDLYFKE